MIRVVFIAVYFRRDIAGYLDRLISNPSESIVNDHIGALDELSLDQYLDRCNIPFRVLNRESLVGNDGDENGEVVETRLSLRRGRTAITGAPRIRSKDKQVRDGNPNTVGRKYPLS